MLERQLEALTKGVIVIVALAGAATSMGSSVVDESVQDFVMSLGHCFVGAATAVYTLGQDAVGAADAFAESDRGLPVGPA